MSIARLVDNENGYEVWRRLVLEYDPESKIRTSRMLAGILRPTFGENSETFTKNLLDWGFAVKRYEVLSGNEMPDAIKIAVVQGSVPKFLEAFLAF